MIRIALICCIVLLSSSATEQLKDAFLVPCTDDNDCKKFLNNSICVNSTFCRCLKPNGCDTVLRSDPVTLVGGFCSKDDDCAFKHSSCLLNSCECMPGYDASADNRRCLIKTLKAGESCEEDMQCQTFMRKLSGCIDSKCDCKPGSHLERGICYESKAIGEACLQNEHCSHVKKSRCNSICQCPYKYVINKKGTACLPVATELRKICQADVQCQAELGEGARCTEKLCQCAEHYYADEKANKCISLLKVGSPCLSSTDCYNGTRGYSFIMKCSWGYCQCRSPLVYIDGACRRPLQSQSGAPMATQQLLLAASFTYIALRLI